MGATGIVFQRVLFRFFEFENEWLCVGNSRRLESMTNLTVSPFRLACCDAVGRKGDTPEVCRPGVLFYELNPVSEKALLGVDLGDNPC